MVTLKSFSVWIYGETTVFNRKKPCLLPKEGYIHIGVAVEENHLIGIKAEYNYGLGKCLSIEYTEEDLLFLGEQEAFLESLVDFIQEMPREKKRELLGSIHLPCFGKEVDNLVHIFLYQLALLLSFKAFLCLPEFWHNSLFPLYAVFPQGGITRNYLKLISTYYVYILSMKLRPELKPIVDTILLFTNSWAKVFAKGPYLDLEAFKAKLNMDILSYVVDGITSRDDSSLSGSFVSHEHCIGFTPQESSECKDTSSIGSIRTYCDEDISSSLGSLKTCPSSLGTLECTPPSKSLSTLECTPPSTCSRSSYHSRHSTACNTPILPIYEVIEKKRQEIEEANKQSTQAIVHNISALSEEVVRYSMGEVRSKIEGCVEESIYNSYPRIKNYIQSALQEKGDYFYTMKEQLEMETKRARELTRQALLAVECIPVYEERIRYLENEIKCLKKGNKDDLHKKVEHLQSSVSQLLRAVRVRV